LDGISGLDRPLSRRGERRAAPRAALRRRRLLEGDHGLRFGLLALGALASRLSERATRIPFPGKGSRGSLLAGRRRRAEPRAAACAPPCRSGAEGAAVGSCWRARPGTLCRWGRWSPRPPRNVAELFASHDKGSALSCLSCAQLRPCARLAGLVHCVVPGPIREQEDGNASD
jgi:hypothetical protein